MGAQQQSNWNQSGIGIVNTTKFGPTLFYSVDDLISVELPFAKKPCHKSTGELSTSSPTLFPSECNRHFVLASPNAPFESRALSRYIENRQSFVGWADITFVILRFLLLGCETQIDFRGRCKKKKGTQLVVVDEIKHIAHKSLKVEGEERDLSSARVPLRSRPGVYI